MQPILIVGTGLAGYTVARELRRLGSKSPLTLVTSDDGAFYSKPTLSNALANGKTPQEIPSATARQMAEQLRAEIVTGVRAQALDTEGCALHLDGETRAYSSLVLALGADPIRLAVDGDGADAIISVNDLADYTRFRKKLTGARRIVIMGAGLIGCEFANDLCGAGHEVSVVDPAPQPLARLLPPSAAEPLRAALATTGVQWLLERTVTRAEPDDGALRLTLSDDSQLDADMVLSAVGLRPRIRLAGDAGLPTARGILADAHLRTRDPRVYALGDCAEVEGLVLPYVMPIMQAARALARTLAGDETRVRYPAMPVVVKTPAWPTVVCPPMPGDAGEWEVRVSGKGVRATCRSATGELLGFVLSGEGVKERAALTPEIADWL